MNLADDVNKVIWNYEDIDMDILKVHNNENTLIGYFNIEIDTFTFTTRKVTVELLSAMMNQYRDAKNEGHLIREE